MSKTSREFAMRLTIVAALALAALWWGTPTVADEGMWVPHHLDNCPVDAWHARGLEIDVGDIHNPDGPSLSDAIVQLGGGTGSFVSFDGLIVTNHHVAYRAIQRSSDVDSDHLAEGFVAASLSDEIALPGFEGKVLLDVVDVTEKVQKAIKDGMTGNERYEAMEKAEKKIVEKAEKGRDVFCEVKPFYGGAQFFLYTYFRIKDIRLVCAPPQSIGEYGGEVDNWMWPRHTGDFSFVRAYVAPDGKSAEYAADNVPYHPRRYLTISTRPLGEGDFTMVLGYPGSTRRYRSSYSIDFFVNHYYPRRIEYFGDVIDILDEESERGREVELKLTGTRRGLANAYKNYHGMLEGLRRADLMGQKLEEEAKLARYLEANPDLAEEFGGVLDDIGANYADYLTYWEQRALLGSFKYASPSMGAASTIYKWAVEREKKDIDRDSGYQDRDERRTRRRLENAGKSYDEQADKRVFAYFLEQLTNAGFSGFAGSAGENDGIAAGATKEEIDALVERLHSGTGVTDDEKRMAMFGQSRKELLASGDPLIEFAARIHDAEEELTERYEGFTGALQGLRPKLMELRAKYAGGALYPDANSTMRLSVGEVKGYSPRDAVSYGFQTKLAGVVEKYTGEKPFDLPPALLELKAEHDFGAYVDPAIDDVPVCFLSTNDVTGGNSGSPILNGKGELIGLVFDGNYESISADFQFIPRLTRTINVDSHYILFVIDKISGARELLNELKISDSGGASR